jgi:hypothetical protein
LDVLQNVHSLQPVLWSHAKHEMFSRAGAAFATRSRNAASNSAPVRGARRDCELLMGREGFAIWGPRVKQIVAMATHGNEPTGSALSRFLGLGDPGVPM